MPNLRQILDENAAWAATVEANDPGFFKQLATGQQPEILWIGCSDSRVPASRVINSQPGEAFVHRNVANVVSADDTNCQAVLQYAVQALKVKHIIVCGHFACGGVCASLSGGVDGHVDQWLNHVRAVYTQHSTWVDGAKDQTERENRLCMANVIEQVGHVCKAKVVSDAWAKGQQLSVHGWIYGLHDGRLRDLGFSVSAAGAYAAEREQVLSNIQSIDTP